MEKILVMNPGSTSTKIAVYQDETPLFVESIEHSQDELKPFENIIDQYEMRKDLIVATMEKNGVHKEDLTAIVSRGGLLPPIKAGAYRVNEDMVWQLTYAPQNEHASNLGGILAREIGDELGVPSYIVDPVVVDELMPSSRLSGVPELPRISVFHALNQKAVAKRYAKEVGKKYTDLNLIVVHMGGGVSVGAHDHGKVVDVYNALDGDGAFSPERAGGVPSGALVKMCFSGEYTQAEVMKKLVGKGGFNAYIGSNDARDLEKLVNDGDEHAKLVQDAFYQQVAKDIGGMATVLRGKVDQIILTGGIAYSKHTCEELEKRAGFIAPFTVYAGEDELLALAQGALRVMNGEEEPMKY